LIREVERAVAGQARVLGINSYAGELIKPEAIRDLMEEVL
jgi:2-oxoglutarate ferredoxin oxidoreductase subunit alpha